MNMICTRYFSNILDDGTFSPNFSLGLFFPNVRYTLEKFQKITCAYNGLLLAKI